MIANKSIQNYYRLLLPGLKIVLAKIRANRLEQVLSSAIS
jgi:hypothetical protein